MADNYYARMYGAQHAAAAQDAGNAYNQAIKERMAQEEAKSSNKRLAQLLGVSLPEEVEAAKDKIESAKTPLQGIGPLANAGDYAEKLQQAPQMQQELAGAEQVAAAMPKKTLADVLRGRSVQTGDYGKISQIGADDANREARLRLTPGQEAADKAFGKDYADYQAGGGKAGVEKNINLLNQAQQGLDETTMLDRAAGVLPKSLRDFLTPKAVAREDAVKSAIQSTLRQTLGSQFTEKEAQTLMDRAYNPRLSAEENKKRIQAAVGELQQRASEKERAARQFEQSGSLVGYSPARGQQMAPASLPSEQGSGLSPEQRQARIQELRKKLGR